MFLLRKKKFLCKSTLTPTALLLYVQFRTVQQTLAVSMGIVKLTNSSFKELLAKFASPKLASHFLFPSKHTHTWKQEDTALCNPRLNQYPSWPSQCLFSFFYLLHFSAAILLFFQLCSQSKLPPNFTFPLLEEGTICVLLPNLFFQISFPFAGMTQLIMKQLLKPHSLNQQF